MYNKQKLHYLGKLDRHSDRIISRKTKLQGETSLQIIQVYAPTSNHDDETVQMFYEELENDMEKKACSHHVVMGDFNVKTGVQNINEHMKCTGPFGIGNRNERGERLLDFAEETIW